MSIGTIRLHHLMTLKRLTRRSGTYTIGGLLVVQAGVLFILGLGHTGLLLSNCVELLIATVVALVLQKMSSKCSGYARGVWQLMTLSYGLYAFALALAIYHLTMPQAVYQQSWMRFLFNMWFAPLGLAILIQPDSNGKWLNRTFMADLVQTLIYSVAAYCYLVASQHPGGVKAGVTTESHIPYVIYCATLIMACFLRSRTSKALPRRALFQQMGIWLSLSLLSNAIHWGSWGASLPPILHLRYSLVMSLPLLFLWHSSAEQFSFERWDFRIGRHSRITLLLPVLYPLLILLMAISISYTQLRLAWGIVGTSFVVSIGRQLLIQDRLSQTSQNLEIQATHDSLTGLWNRGAILSILGIELQRAERTHATVGVIMFDIDHFKSVNDSYGHAAGDRLLEALTAEVASSLRPYDSVGRYGGEEFLIVAPECTTEDAMLLADRVRNNIASVRVTLSQASISTTASAGVATGGCAEGVDAVLQRADMACYRAKEAGRNQIVSAT